MLEPENLYFISDIVARWYSLNKRDLPWRDTKDPYRVWISEIILQQTRVAQGYEYYLRFIKTFPNVSALAAASEGEVLKLWQGLGYYSRARNLHEAAKTIINEHNGIFPSDYSLIRKLKGVGEYTAAAIASFAFDLPYAALDGNVYRVLSRLFAIDTPIDSTEGKKLFSQLAGQLLNPARPALHNQAMMEFGALQCVPVSPNCAECPLAEKCVAYANGNVRQYPVKQGKTLVKERFFNYLDIRQGNSLYLHKREGNDVWKNLYELPLIETGRRVTFEELQAEPAFAELFRGVKEMSVKPLSLSLKHVLSHRIIYAGFYQITIDESSSINNRYIKVKPGELEGYAVSRLVEKYLEGEGRNTP
jgi:A/G-specific adenine glycosylase